MKKEFFISKYGLPPFLNFHTHFYSYKSKMFKTFTG